MIDLNDPNLDDTAWLMSAKKRGAQLGGAQWMSHTAARRNKTVTDALDDRQQQMADPSMSAFNDIDPGSVVQRIREEANAQFTDPTGALGFFAPRQAKTKIAVQDRLGSVLKGLQ